MANALKRFTISLTPQMAQDLESIKKEYFCYTAQSQMLRELIQRGLDSLADENQSKNNQNNKSA